MQQVCRGVLPGPTGSEVCKFPGLRNGDYGQLLGTEAGLRAIRAIAESYREEATVGTAFTFRVTQFRAADTGWKFDPGKRFELDSDYRSWNQEAVRIARDTYDKRIVLGTVAPTTNTSASDDDRRFALLGGAEARITFSYQRQLPQLQVLTDAGVDGILVEACRFRDDALGIARAAERSGARLLIVSFEADANGFPDPLLAREGYTFRNMKDDLQAEVGRGMTVMVGANCTSATMTSRLVDRRETLDVVYPNVADLERPIDAATVKALFAAFSEHSDNRQAFKVLSAAVSTPISVLQGLWRAALESHAAMIGICCGGTADHVRAARRVYDSFQQAKERQSAGEFNGVTGVQVASTL